MILYYKISIDSIMKQKKLFCIILSIILLTSAKEISETNTNTKNLSDSIISYLKEVNYCIPDTVINCIETWKDKNTAINFYPEEYNEINIHLWAALNPRFTKEQKQENLIKYINYKFQVEELETKKPESKINKNIVDKLFNDYYWNGIATIEDKYLGSDQLLVILIGQKHAFYHTEKENAMIKNIQDNIIEIQEKLYNNGVRVFGYEGGTFKEKGQNFPTNLPYNKIIELYEKKCEVDFKNNHLDIYSYGIENVELHKKADSLFTLSFIIDQFFYKDTTIFPIKKEELHKKICYYIEYNQEEYLLRNLKIDNKRLLDTAKSFFKYSNTISLKEFNDFRKKIALDANKVIINERNHNFTQNIITLNKITKEPYIALKIGLNHLQPHPFFEELGLKLESLQSSLKKENISYLYLMPDSVKKYINIEFTE